MTRLPAPHILRAVMRARGPLTLQDLADAFKVTTAGIEVVLLGLLADGLVVERDSRWEVTS